MCIIEVNILHNIYCYFQLFYSGIIFIYFMINKITVSYVVFFSFTFLHIVGTKNTLFYF